MISHIFLHHKSSERKKICIKNFTIESEKNKERMMKKKNIQVDFSFALIVFVQKMISDEKMEIFCCCLQLSHAMIYDMRNLFVCFFLQLKCYELRKNIIIIMTLFSFDLN